MRSADIDDENLVDVRQFNEVDAIRCKKLARPA
jgi:hypothetical protein